jgi:dCTP deaminase
MLIKSDRLAALLENESQSSDPLMIIPRPEPKVIRGSGSASIDLRLGTWFATLRHTRLGMLELPKWVGAESRRPGHSSGGRKRSRDRDEGEYRLTRRHYVRFGDTFVLHPRNFVLGVTMEWLRLPSNVAGYVTAKSSWGRRGLVIATATGVHPGFTGCLTLELTNLGEVPIPVMPGWQVCQLFLHSVATDSDKPDASRFIGYRRPTLGSIRYDPIAEKLSKGDRVNGLA